MIHESSSKDIVKWCNARPDEFLVSDDKELIEQYLKPDAIVKTEKQFKELSKMKVEEIKAYAIEKGIELPESLTKTEMIAIIEGTLDVTGAV